MKALITIVIMANRASSEAISRSVVSKEEGQREALRVVVALSLVLWKHAFAIQAKRATGFRGWC